MKVLHFGTIDVKAGGPAMSIYLTLKGLYNLGVNIRLIQYPIEKNSRLKGDLIPITYASKPINKKFAFSLKLKKEILELGEYDIYHAQGVWQWPTYAIADIAKSLNRPYIITPRGMLYPQDIKKSNPIIKHISLKLKLLNDLNRAACIHVTCEEEMQHCRNLGVISPIAIIPNPIEIKKYKYQKEDSIFRLGYLGRLSPRKNIESLIIAFFELKEITYNAELLIIGGGDITYEKKLRKMVKDLRLSNIKFVGFLSGEEKDKAIASCSVIAMPSEFENLGNVILEGLAHSIPCIATKGSPWKELQEYKCGWWVDFSQEAITEAIKVAATTSSITLAEMGARGRKLIEERYSEEYISNKFMKLYQWIIKGFSKPDFVYE